ncbi:MAG TPA: CBS domain-containing protein [Fervidobacterium sp.]|nr:CBS domain-containing protein [Fervidobacterium sp.]HOQ40023.1 CBS domain-containing protein [Fervidobacterium sp.]HPP18021.1 CBS domain-containing protein [Fervidobacterium sp.]HPT54478.1 CBS domain-containing protein [Fervidobacterium sp.]HPZ17927.1 CBS domain-containing protein [Fervidobacterium sp.]
MKVITSHVNADFDSFASCIGLKKLNTDFEIVLHGVPVQNLKEYLKLYGDTFSFMSESDLKNFNEPIDELIIVDTNGLERIGEEIRERLSKDAKITIIDHHPDIRPVDEQSTIDTNIKRIIKQTGAATTLVVNMIKESMIRLTSDEATLLAIGIYEDTGSLLFSSTTIEDIEAVLYLLKNGALINVVAEYVKFDLTLDQKEILNNLLQNITTYNVDDYEITITYAESEKFIGGLSAVISKLQYTHSVETLISIVRMGKKVFVVARTKSTDIDLAGLMAEFGGGGHKQAASATISIASVDEVIHKILQFLPKYIFKGVKAQDIMSSPVRTVFANETIEDVNRIMEITGHGGLPVTEGNKLVGIVTKKSVDKAMNHGLGKRPVKSIMSSKLVTARVDTPLYILKKMMIENDIGRIPILDANNILVGIVTRSDIIKATSSEVPISRFVENATLPSFANLSKTISKRLPSRVVNLLRLLGLYGSDFKMSVYVVGGFVRDLLLGIPNYDIDIVVEGNGIDFAKHVGRQLNATVVPYEKFFTATIVFKDGFRIDVATARTEYYDQPGKLPHVDISSIKKDLYRRDFTINAMAIKLNPQEYGVLYDFFNCQKDLEERVIRVLHSLSFVEDPTRMIRAVRFEQRYDFKMEPYTLELLKKNLEENYLERVSGARVRQEIEKILEEENSLKAIKRMAELGMIRHIFPKTYYTKTMEEKLETMFQYLPHFKERFEGMNDFYALSTILLEYYDLKTLEELRTRYGYPKKFIESLKYAENIIPVIKSVIESRFNFSDIYKVLGKSNPYIYVHLSAYLDEESLFYLLKYIDTVQHTRITRISGKMLVEEYNLKAGPVLNSILEQVFALKLDDPNLDEEEAVRNIIGALKITSGEN